MKKLYFLSLLLFCGIPSFAQLSFCSTYFLYADSACTHHYATIDAFVLNGSSGSINDLAGCSGTGYEDRSALSTTLSSGYTYTAYISTGSMPANCQIWIDFNDDGNYDVSETVGGCNNIAGSDNAIIITIPFIASMGNHGMRVNCIDTASGIYYPMLDPCYAYSATLGDARQYSISNSFVSPDASSDSFSVFVNHLCTGTSFSINTASYYPGMSVKTWFGDGTSNTTAVVSGGFGGCVPAFTHTYAAAGTYSVKQLLYSGSTAIDSILYSSDYVNCNQLSVKFYVDANNNCVADNDEFFYFDPISTEVDSNGVAIDTISAISGFYYNAYGSPGDIYAFRPLSAPIGYSISCPVSGIFYDTISAGAYDSVKNNFALQCTTIPGFDLSVNSVIEGTGFHYQGGSVYLENHSCNPTNADVTVYFSPKYVTEFTSPTPASTSSTSITWHVSEISSTTPYSFFYGLSDNPATGYLTIGDTVHTYVTVTPTTGDTDTSNNHTIVIDTVKSGYDPNEMSVSPSGCIGSPSPVSTLQYSIGFENTGNDTAHNIYVMDTLSDNTDPSSVNLLFASAEMFVSKIHSGGHTILKFDFPHINLLDSSHHNQCNGAVIFNINTKSGLSFGTTIDNRAGIYFDYNDVVMTNTTENTIGCPVATEVPQNKSVSLDVYPNPAGNELYVRSGSNSYSSFVVTNAIGQEIMQGPINGAVTRLNINLFAPGLYYIAVKGTDDVQVRKWLKQ